MSKIIDVSFMSSILAAGIHKNPPPDLKASIPALMKFVQKKKKVPFGTLHVKSRACGSERLVTKKIADRPMQSGPKKKLKGSIFFSGSPKS